MSLSGTSWRAALAPISLFAVFVFVGPTLSCAQQLPRGGSVTAGSASIGTPQGGTLNINQSSDRAIINWHSYSIGQGGTVNYHQPSTSSATLNRVTGNTPSSIAGTINAPGTVLLVNPNGIAITKDGVINTGSFAASTLDIKDSDFMSGNYKFTGKGNSAAVTNAGRINVSDGGFAALLGGQVANDGVIRARLGKVALGSGELITLDLAGDGFLSVAVPTKDLGKIKGADGKTLVTNRGKIVADGGVVELKAATAAGILRDAVNVPGSIRANSVGLRNGRIVLGGGAGGRVRIAGRVRARGRHHAHGGKVTVTGAAVHVSGKISTASKHGKGGVVILAANDVKIGSHAKLDASGAIGGTLLIGGDVHGGADPSADFSIQPVANAFTTTVAAGAVLKANGTNGDGGNIVVWSNEHTTFAGQLSVAGVGGHGGFAEVSSHRLLDFTGSVDLAGSAGAGTLLLDPYNVIISNGTNNTGGSFAGNTNNSVIKVADLEDALSKGNVEVSTGSDGYQAGDITVSDPVSWSANTLTLVAHHSIMIDATLSASGGAGLTLTTNHGGGSGGDLYFGGGSVNFASSNESLIINGHGYTLVSTIPQLANDIAVQSDSGYYALSSNYDAAPVSYVSAPIGTTFYGTFEGLGHTIANLTISATSEDDVGLFGNSSGTIRDIGMIGESITGHQYVGGLVGINAGTISHAYATGSVTGVNDDVGGLAGTQWRGYHGLFRQRRRGEPQRYKCWRTCRVQPQLRFNHRRLCHRVCYGN